MFVLSWKLTAVTLALAPICILAAASSSFMSSNLKKTRLAADDGAAAIARLSLQHPAAVKALCIEDAVAAHYGQLYDAFIAAFSPAKNSVCRILISTSFQVPLHPLIKTPNLECINTALPSSCLLPCAHTSAASLSPASKCAPPSPPHRAPHHVCAGAARLSCFVFPIPSGPCIVHRAAACGNMHTTPNP